MISGINLNAVVGNFEIQRLHAKLNYDRKKIFSTAEIKISDIDRSLENIIKKEDDAILYYGFRNGVQSSFKGTVSSIAVESDSIVLHIIGKEKLFQTTKIIQTWLNETPESIIKYAISNAGLEVGRIDSTGCVFPKFISSNFNVWEIAWLCRYQCEKTYNIKMDDWDLWLDSCGKVNWGDFSETIEKIPVIETSKGLINHQPANVGYQQKIVESFLLPGFIHSMDFRLIDDSREINKVYRAISVEHEISSHARTKISYLGGSNDD